jgi:hypothetical protein
MLISALDCKLYDKIYLGKYNDWIHLIIIISPFVYFYYIGKHHKNIVVNKTITVNMPQKIVQPIPQPRPYQPQVREPQAPSFKKINQPEFYARHGGFDVRDAKTIDYTVVEPKEES